MKKIFILMIMVLGLVACGEKFPYTSQSKKEKMIKELQVAIEKAEKTKDDIIEKYGNFYLIISIIYFFIALLFRNSRYIYIVTSLSIIPILYYKWWLLKFVRYKTNDRFNN